MPLGGTYAGGLRVMETGGLPGLSSFPVRSVLGGCTVRLAVHARADEIEIQRFIEAGVFCVPLPFYFHAAFEGGIGAASGTAVLYGLYRFDLPAIGRSLEPV